MDRTELTIAWAEIEATQIMRGLMERGGYIRLDASTKKWVDVKCHCNQCEDKYNER